MKPTDHWTLLMTIVTSASFALGFVTQVTSYEKEDRSRRTQVSALAGLLLGSLASAQQNGDVSVAFAGLLGAGAGAAVGWAVVLLISWWAEKRERRGALLVLTGGPGEVSTYLDEQKLERRLSRDVRERKLRAVREWGNRYGQMVRESRSALDEVGEVDPATVEAVVRLWLRAMVDGFNYLMEDLPAVVDPPPKDKRRSDDDDADDADEDEDEGEDEDEDGERDGIGEGGESKYRVRASLIVFERESGRYVGRHWIHYAGTGTAHSKETVFQADSTAWLVASRALGSPCIPPEPREKRKGAKDRYSRYGVSLVLERRLVISVDWFLDTDYVETLQAVADGQLAGQVADLLRRHHPDFKPADSAPAPPAADPAEGSSTSD